MLITEEKLVYPEFKVFKNIYTSINFSEKIIFINGIGYFSKDTDFFYFYGKFNFNNRFFNWLKDKVVEANISDLVLLGKVLKKNVVSVEDTENSFIFKYNNSETNTTEIVSFKTTKQPEYINKINQIKETLVYENELPINWLADNILKLYIKNNDIKNTKENGYTKLIEIPVKKINVLLKNGLYKLLYSDIINESRYICLNSKDETLGLELNQLCLCLV